MIKRLPLEGDIVDALLAITVDRRALLALVPLGLAAVAGCVSPRPRRVGRTTGQRFLLFHDGHRTMATRSVEYYSRDGRQADGPEPGGYVSTVIRTSHGSTWRLAPLPLAPHDLAELLRAEAEA